MNKIEHEFDKIVERPHIISQNYNYSRSFECPPNQFHELVLCKTVPQRNVLSLLSRIPRRSILQIRTKIFQNP